MEPFLLEPAYKDYLWGGTRLKTEYGKETDLEIVAESWECSVHPDGPSRIASGPWKGRTLAEFLEAHPEAMGTHGKKYKTLPILVKLIDAKENLSVQVHPDDAYALEREGQLGKTELWYVLKADPGATLIYGFAHDVTPELVRKAVRDGTILDHLQRVPVHEGDVFLIEPGTVHAIGGGVLLAEIQENSNVTYRVYDYDRLGKDGKPRELHLEKALEVMNFKAAKEPRSPQRVIRYTPGVARELIGRCRYFQVERVSVREEYEFDSNEESFMVLLLIEEKMASGKKKGEQQGKTFFLQGMGKSQRLLGKFVLLQITI